MNTPHPSKHASDSACSIILNALKARPGEWIPMPELVNLSGAYHVNSRVDELRKNGYNIENRKKHEGRKVHSFYRIAN